MHIRNWATSQGELTPRVVGQAVAFEIMYHKRRDGWNSLGTEGDCKIEDEHFCPKFADTTGYKPESGPCKNVELEKM